MSWSACPKCGARCYIIDTRETSTYVRRRVGCVGKPVHRFTTIELITPPWITPGQVAELFTNIPMLARNLQPLSSLLRSLDPWQKKK